MSNTAALALLLLSLLQLFVVPSLACNPNEYWKDGKCCDKCPPGQKLVSTCTEAVATKCEDCGANEFQNQWNIQKTCQPMSHCDHIAGFVQESPGSREKDAVCMCAEGRHCSSVQCETCVQDTACGPGFGVTERATKLFDTRCEKCQTGFFSNETSLTTPCYSWTRCDVQSLLEEAPGSAVSDVICVEDRGRSRYVIAVSVALAAVVAILIVIAVILGFQRAKAKDPLNCKKMFEQKQYNPAEEEEEPISPPQSFPGSPVQESHSIQEVWKDSHLPQQEVV
ncbi:tumor necrosis factor receptor superfamily member 5 isoform X2 [Ambystoma mexicanum]|uniref:tumor necrosis factor receptor superfamily member 5 isoform X2 n=1 Tax=Ambystoma mexicanum TaxID=8296 RepID=UPI0037E9128E